MILGASKLNIHGPASGDVFNLPYYLANIEAYAKLY